MPRLAPLNWLIWCQSKAAFRSLYRRSFSTSGLYFVFIALLLLFFFRGDRMGVPPFLGTLFYLFGPLVLMLLTLFAARTGVSQNPFSFNAAETTFLLTAPLSPAQLLMHKILQFNLTAILVSVFSSLVIASTPLRTLETFFKFYLVIFFLQALPVAVATLVPNKNGRLAQGLRLSLDAVMGIFLVSLFLAVYLQFLGREDMALIFRKFLHEVTSPFFFTDNFLYPKDQRAHLTALLRFLIPDLVFAGLFIWGYRRLELESVFYKNLNENRGRLSLGNRQGIALPLRWFFSLKGFGPVLWMRTQEFVRNWIHLLLLYFLLLVSFCGFAIFMMRVFPPGEELGLKLWHLHNATRIFGIIAILFSGFCDFRGDTSKIAFYKTWPVAGWRIVAAHTLVSVLHLSIAIASMTLAAALLYRSYTPFKAWEFIGWSFLTIPTAAFLLATWSNSLFLFYPVAESKAQGRTWGRAAMQYFLLLLLTVSIGRLFFFVDEKLAGLARGQDHSHWIFFGSSAGLYLFLGAVGFLLSGWLFRRFDPSKVR